MTLIRFYQRLRQMGTINDSPKSGRLHVTSPKPIMRQTHLRNRFHAAVEMTRVTQETHNTQPSYCLREFGYVLIVVSWYAIITLTTSGQNGPFCIPDEKYK